MKPKLSHHLTSQLQRIIQLLGTLIYITKSRPDIQASISFAATHSKTPTREHYIQLLKLVEYIKQTKDEGLIINSYEDQIE